MNNTDLIRQALEDIVAAKQRSYDRCLLLKQRLPEGESDEDLDQHLVELRLAQIALWQFENDSSPENTHGGLK